MASHQQDWSVSESIYTDLKCLCSITSPYMLLIFLGLLFDFCLLPISHLGQFLPAVCFCVQSRTNGEISKNKNKTCFLVGLAKSKDHAHFLLLCLYRRLCCSSNNAVIRTNEIFCHDFSK